ncbi:OmpL47-type beta-barrel domain-containing protein [Saccharicrinis sp. GN24d3]|uniref:OmpL47-type beta-barrel domain-containing protein n=1 Tax=Saccharicrinis sp. GN24d3 TaxID=3458416 RepID=UPI00403682EC
MNKTTLVIHCFIMFVCSTVIRAQNPILPKPTFYVDSLNRYYMQAELPVFFSISHAENKEGEKLSPADDGGAVNERKPIYMDGHGKHKIRHMDSHQGKTLDAFTIYADGKAPKTLVKTNNVPAYRSQKAQYFGKNLVVSLSATDEMSGLKNIYFSVNNEPFKSFTGEFVASKEGDYYLQYYATDNVGNAEKLKQYKFTLDLTPPKTFYHIVGIAKDNIISTSTRLYLTTSDSLSGTGKVYYHFDNDRPQVYLGNDLPVSQLDDGHHTLNYYAVDRVNNKAENEQLKFYLDKTAPIVSADVLGDKFIVGDKVYYSGRTKLKLTAVDNKSGIKDVGYSLIKRCINY